MNSDSLNNPREDLEIRITALLLGELDPAEAERVRQSISQDPDLARLHDQLKQTLGLVKDASADLADETAPLRLSGEKREALFAHFKARPIPQLASGRSRALPWYVPAGIAAILIGLMAWVALLPATREFAAKRPSRVTPLAALRPPEPEPAEELFQHSAATNYVSTTTFGSDSQLRRDDLNARGGAGMDQIQSGVEYSLKPTEPAADMNSYLYADGGGVAGESVNDIAGSLGLGRESGTATPSAEDGAAPVVLPRVGHLEQPNDFDWNRNGGVDEPAAGGVASDPDWIGVLNSAEKPHGADTRFVARYSAELPPDSAQKDTELDLNRAHEAGKRQTRASGQAEGYELNQGEGALSWGFSAATDGREGPLNAGSLGEPVPNGSADQAGERRLRERYLAGYSQSGIALPEPQKPERLNQGSNARPTSDHESESANGNQKPAEGIAANYQKGIDRVPSLGDIPAPTAFYRMQSSQSQRDIPAATGLPGESAQLGVGFRNPDTTKASVASAVNPPIYGLPPQEGQTASPVSPPQSGEGGEGIALADETHIRNDWFENRGTARATKQTEESIDRLRRSGVEGEDSFAARGEQGQNMKVFGGLLSDNSVAAGQFAWGDEAGRKTDRAVDFGIALGAGPDTDGPAFEKAPAPALKVAGITTLSGRAAHVVQVPVARPSEVAQPELSAVKEAVSRQPDTIVVRQKEQELKTLLAQRDALEERIDVSLPQAAQVQIVDRAEPSKPGFVSRLLGREAQGVARIKLEQERSGIQGLSNPSATASYDPYFIQTESEVIQSEPVLAKAVEKLNETTGDQSDKLTIAELKKHLDLKPVRNTSLFEIRAKSEDPKEAAEMANAVAEAYRGYRLEQNQALSLGSIGDLGQQVGALDKEIRERQAEVDNLRSSKAEEDLAPRRTPSPEAPVPQPEVQTTTNLFSTFSLNVSDVAFKLAAASLAKGQMPDPASVRSEEFINAFDYRDPAPVSGQPLAFAWERARYPFAHNRDLLRFSIQTAARGREAGRPLNLVLLLDNSGSMERADRVRIIRECLNVLAGQLTAPDKISVVTFARTPRLWVDGVPGVQAAASLASAGQLTPEGGTNLEEAMNLAYATALRHYLADGINRVVLLTDGAANLGNVDPESLKAQVEAFRRQGIALDCFGIGWEGYNDDLLEVLSRNGDGRYGFVNTPEDASREFAGQLAGALQVAASDVKVQVEFNPARVTAYRQIGYAKHQLTKEQFRDNTVDAAEIGAAESGNALYVVQTNPQGQGPIAIVRARFKVPATGEYKEYEWTVPYTGEAVALENASAAMRLAATGSAFSEWLVASPYAGEVTPDRLLNLLRGVPEVFGADPRPKKLEWMIREAQRISGQ